MGTRTLIFILGTLAGMIVAFEAYGIYRLKKPLSSPAEEALDRLCSQLAVIARQKGMDGAVRGLEHLTGPEEDPEVQAWVPLLNARVSRDVRLFLFPDYVRKAGVAETSRQLELKAWRPSSPGLVSVPAEGFLMGEWAWVQPRRELRLTLRLVRMGITGEGVQVTGSMIHPRERRREQTSRDRWIFALFSATAPLAGLCLLSVRSASHHLPVGGTRHVSPS